MDGELGLEEAILEGGGEATVSEKSVEELKNGVCPICLVDFEKEEPQVQHLKCGNGFHKECLVAWLVNKRVCPMCRGEILR